MSAIYYPTPTSSTSDLIFTGGHDGTLIAWNFETGYRKHNLHEIDPTCTSNEYYKDIKDGKSVDQLLILDARPKPKLISMSANQWLRFWDLDELCDQKPFKFYCKHPEDDGLTSIATTKDNDLLITADTSGQLKLWDISEVDFDN